MANFRLLQRQKGRERERNRKRARQRGMKRRSQWLSPVCACLSILSTNMYCKCLCSQQPHPESLRMLMLTVPLTTALDTFSSQGFLLAAGFFRHIYFIVGPFTQDLEVLLDALRGRRWCDVHGGVRDVWVGQKQGSHSTSVLGSSALQKGWSVFKWHCSRSRLEQKQTSPSQSAPVCPSF